MQNIPVPDAMDLLQQGLARARRQGASAALLRLRRKETAGCGLERDKLKTAEAARHVDIDVDLVVDGRRGRSTLNDPADLEEMVDRTVVLARSGAHAHFADYPPPGAMAAVKTHSPATGALSPERMADACRRIAITLRAFDPDLHVQADVQRQEWRSVIVTSGGVCCANDHTEWGLFAWAQQTRGTDMLSTWFVRQGKDLDAQFEPDLVSREILEDLRRGQTIVPAGSGPATILLSPLMVHEFLGAVRMGVDGRNVAKGDSPLRGRLGEQVLDPVITLVDDPHKDYHVGASAVSGEGVPTRHTTIFERGVLRAFLYDVDTAGMAGVAPTGHDGCSPWSLDVASGQRTAAEMIASIEDGLYIKELLGFGQGNLLNGDFSCNAALTFRIRRGEIVGRVKNTMIAGNIYELLKSGVQLSSDKDPVFRMPHALLRGAHVSAAGS